MDVVVCHVAVTDSSLLIADLFFDLLVIILSPVHWIRLKFSVLYNVLCSCYLINVGVFVIKTI